MEAHMTTNGTKLALVTGTSSGIGAAVATQLLATGWDVVGVARRPARLTEARYHHVQLDLADPKALVTRIPAALDGRLGADSVRRVALVNNAATAGSAGPLDRLELEPLLEVYALNLAAPIWLMGYCKRAVRPGVPVRIVNVSSGAAVNPFPGLGAYGSGKAGLRMAGMIYAAELDSPPAGAAAAPDISILSYEPGVVETEMQVAARATPETVFPWVGIFHQFKEQGLLVPPEMPAREITAYLERDGHPRFSERRFGSA
jgi:NAD(P)-dependent dehydrogenase (short-subunit alcohol dehydrogenase family)